jgi:LysM repeat protein
VSNRPGAGKSRGAARIIAPIALILFAFACFTVLTNSDDGKPAKPNSTKSATKSTKATTDSNGNVTVTTRKTYTVKSGDSFDSIAAKFNLDVTTLTALNSDIDPRALQPGQKLKLK